MEAHNDDSDTIASTLVFTFYRLARHPDHLRKLHKELDGLDSPTDFAALQHAQHLNSVIKETMRLHPAVITGSIRETPPEGAIISGRFVPGRIKICAPRYVIGRRAYSAPIHDHFVREIQTLIADLDIRYSGVML
ncbi:MAG: hypothetical protein Q9181_005424 [Wetmoreana brouardii]